MKKIILLFAMMAFSLSAFAQTPEYEVKAKDYAKKSAIFCLDLINGEDVESDMSKMGEDMGKYIVSLETKEKITAFLSKYNEYIYYYFDSYGLGEELATEYLKNFYEGILESL